MAENQNSSTPEKVSGSFVKAPEVQAPVPVAKELTLNEMLTRIYEVEVFIGKTLKDTNELLATVLENEDYIKAISIRDELKSRNNKSQKK